MEFRIGQGIDIHQFVEGRKLILGGVEIPHSKGLEGHSDADALIHAIVDALLGAVGCDDIGSYFPNDQAKWKNANSKIFLEKSLEIISEKGWRIVNLDCTILLEAPKLAQHKQAIRESLANVLSIGKDNIAIKATTSEKLGFVGRSEGIWVSCVCLLCK